MLFQKHFIWLISVSFVDLLKRDLAARVGGGGGEGHTSTLYCMYCKLIVKQSNKF